jgi:hypothetical protein
MATYSFTAYKVTYSGDEPVSFDLTTFEVVFDENDTPALIYSVLNAPFDDIPEVDFVSSNEYDVRVDGVSLNQSDFLDGNEDAVYFGTVEWDRRYPYSKNHPGPRAVRRRDRHRLYCPAFR